ncbi:MAG: sigma-70 family RNA polymerase sigma factor [Acidobacteriota bacterium]
MNDDIRLVRKALKGDRKAFEMIVVRYQQPLVNYLARMTGEREAALDFAQDVFLKAYSSLDSYRPSFKFSTWLFKIASNHMIDHWRKKRITAVSLDQPFDDDEPSRLIQVEDHEPSVARKYELAEIRGRIEGALREIPAGLRELFVLRHINEFSYEEIADIKGLPVGTVKNRVFQAKETLRRRLEAAP